ncbi:hypothetical protein VE02_01085 [Pseudogymnoascus sp. 03VT05]|nr:hypothetical protein VE02_01085 [Pseudogymnoascus sp. 03VT05]
MASSSFRDSMNSLGWSRREEAPIDTSQQSGLLSSIKSLNPFGGDGYVQLPTTEGPGAPLPAPNRREEEEGFFALSRWDRILIFSGCNVGALACFVICFALFPVMALKPRKFAILWSLGSVLFLASWAVMMGPLTYGKHLVSAQRLPFTAAYFGSIGLTLYFSLGQYVRDEEEKFQGGLGLLFAFFGRGRSAVRYGQVDGGGFWAWFEARGRPSPYDSSRTHSSSHGRRNRTVFLQQQERRV